MDGRDKPGHDDGEVMLLNAANRYCNDEVEEARAAATRLSAERVSVQRPRFFR